MILSSNFPSLAMISAQYYVKCGHEYDFSLIQSISLAHFTYIWGCIFLLYVFPWSLELCLRLVLFVTRSKGSIPRQREPCSFLVGSNAVVGMLIVELFAYDHGSDLHNRLFIFDFSKSWGSFYVKGVLFSFVVFGGLVSNFFDVAYPGVHGCVSLCSGIIMVWLGSPGFASSLELDNCFFQRCFSFRWRSCRAWVLDYEKVVSGYQLIRSVGHPVLASFSPLN